MDIVKRFLDKLVGAPPPVVQEAQRNDMRFDKTQLDKSLGAMLAAHDEFANIVRDVVRDVGIERRQRRAYAKTTSRPRKT